MRWRFIANMVALLVVAIGACMLLPLCISFYYGSDSVMPAAVSMAITLAAGGCVFFATRGKPVDIISAREGMAIVTFGWIAVGAFGSLPFYFCGQFGSFVDALFESVSGFTTTGASVLTQIEALDHDILFWRSFIQWLGGMGIIVLSVAILPFLGVGGMQLYKAEVPSPVPDKLKPRIRDTAMIMWKIYALLSLAEVLLLMLGGMGLFEALNHAFTTMPTGGFSTKNTSIAHYDSLYIDLVIVAFMLLAGINFSLHYQLLRGKTLIFWRDPECRFFLGAVIALTLLVAFDTYGEVYRSVGDALRYSAFQVVSIVTTTGFATADYELWPGMSQLILLLCMIMGASAGSTGGGVKCLRIMLCFKYCYRELFMLVHPRAVQHIKVAGKPVPEDVMRSVMGFLALFMGLFGVSAVVLAGMGLDFVTAIGAVAATLGNIGPGFGGVGPTDNFAAIPSAGKWVLIWCMLLGRLEIYTVIILLAPAFWRR